MVVVAARVGDSEPALRQQSLGAINSDLSTAHVS